MTYQQHVGKMIPTSLQTILERYAAVENPNYRDSATLRDVHPGAKLVAVQPDHGFAYVITFTSYPAIVESYRSGTQQLVADNTSHTVSPYLSDIGVIPRIHQGREVWASDRIVVVNTTDAIQAVIAWLQAGNWPTVREEPARRVAETIASLQAIQSRHMSVVN